MLTTYASDATVAVLADWAEVDHLLSDRPRSTDSRIIRADRASTDELEHGELFDEDSGETLDLEIIDYRIEQRRQSLWLELTSRQEALGDAYPFEVTQTSTGWAIALRKGGEREARVARLGYKLALLMASIKHHHIQKQGENSAIWDELETEIADRFQALSVLAANNVFGPKTEVYWFGFPRPDHTGFHNALPKLIDKLGLGTIKDKPPYGTENDQDATIDLVAWRSFSDHTYGTLILYGQVASGNNWDSKSIHSHINDRFFDHFIDQPSKHYIGATFIPFVLHNNTKTPKDGDLASAMTDYARRMEISHGLLLDRIRITELLSAGIADSKRRHNAPTPCASAHDALGWVSKTKDYCDGAA